jgi:hypothetical protein
MSRRDRSTGRPGGTARVLAAVLACGCAGLVLAACSAGQPRNQATGPGGSRPPGPPGKARGFLHAVQGGGRGSRSFNFKIAPGGGNGPHGTVVFVGPGGAAHGAIAAVPIGFGPGFGGPAGGAGRPHIVVGSIPAANSGQTVALPLDSYEQVSVSEQQALSAAGDLLTQRCMAARGFAYTGAAQPGGGAASVESIEDGGYGVASLTQAEVYGYKQTGSGGGPLGIVIPAFLSQQDKHGQAWTSALLGFVPGSRPSARQPSGCLQEADVALYGKLQGNPDPDPVPGIALEAASWTQSDPRIVLLDRLWSACMARHGYNYKSPEQAELASWPSSPTSAEIATAVADVKCKTQTNLVNTWLTVEAAYQAVLIGDNLTELSRLQTNFAKLLRRAEATLQLSADAFSAVMSRNVGGPGQQRQAKQRQVINQGPP